MKALLPPAEVVLKIRKRGVKTPEEAALLNFLDVAIAGLLGVIAGATAGLADALDLAAQDPTLQLCNVVSALRATGDADETTFTALRNEYVRLTGLGEQGATGR